MATTSFSKKTKPVNPTPAVDAVPEPQLLVAATVGRGPSTVPATIPSGGGVPDLSPAGRGESAFGISERSEAATRGGCPSSDLCPQSSEIPSMGGISGDYQESDFRLPRINIVQSVGPLSEDFDPGTIVLNKDQVILPASEDPKVWGTPLNITVLNAKKQFQENIEYGSDDMPETVDTLEEVTARGGWIDWRGEEKPPWRPMLTALLLIEAPNEQVADEFSIQGPDDKAYELALWTMKGTSYSRAGKAINTAARFALRNKDTGLPELHKGKWTLQVRREKLGTNLVFVPRLRQHGKHDDDFIAFITTLL